MNTVINVEHFRALYTVAGKKDVRYYLNGICLDPAKSRAIATDGHRMLTMPCSINNHLKEKVIISLPSKMPKISDGAVAIGITNGREVEFTYIGKKGETTKHIGKVIDGNYPEIDRVMPKGKKDKQDSLLINPLLIADIQKALGSNGVEISNHKNCTACKVKFQNFPEVDCAIMPMRTLASDKKPASKS